MSEKLLIYQVLPRLFGNSNTTNKENGSIDDNGSGKFSTFSAGVLNEIRSMGFSHIWYTGILEHATRTDYSVYGIRGSDPDVVKGNAGSPYAIRDYYDVSPDFATDVEKRMDEFEELVRRTHDCGLKVIIDFVPNHVAREYFSDARPEDVIDLGDGDDTTLFFSAGNNFYYIPGQPLRIQLPGREATYTEFPAKASGNDRFDNHPGVNDWYETVKLNYGIDYSDHRRTFFSPVPDTWFKMRDILFYWAAKGVDGFRCDMAEMVPVDFWNWVIPAIKSEYSSVIFIAEIYNPAEYRNYICRGNFDYLYDKVGLYDTVREIICGHRPASDITNCWQDIDGLQEHMLNFLENHDEQRIASDFFARDPFKAVPGMIVSATMNVNPVMVYAGQELGERGMDKEGFSSRDGRTSIFDYWSPDTLRMWTDTDFDGSMLTAEQDRLRLFYIRLLHICNDEEAICKGGFHDLMYVNHHNPRFNPAHQYAYLRFYGKTFMLVVCSFHDQPASVDVNLPRHVFDSMGIDPSSARTFTDLLSGECRPLDKGWEDSFTLDLAAYSGSIIRFNS